MPEKAVENEKVAAHSGKLETFLIHVQYRQNATWQGEVVWAEKNESLKFRSALELFKIMDGALNTEE